MNNAFLAEYILTCGEIVYTDMQEKESDMATVFITTIVGEDKPNTIKDIAEMTRSLGGEWSKSKVNKLDNQFAALMKVVIDEGSEQALKDKLQSAYPDLHFFHAPATDLTNGDVQTVSLTVDCEDRPGLTHDIVKVLSDLNLEAENMEFHRLPVTPVGGTVYTAKMTVRIPENMEKESLAESIESLSDCIRVHFD